MNNQAVEQAVERGEKCPYCDVPYIADMELDGEVEGPTGRLILVCPDCCYAPDHDEPELRE